MESGGGHMFVEGSASHGTHVGGDCIQIGTTPRQGARPKEVPGVGTANQGVLQEGEEDGREQRRRGHGDDCGASSNCGEQSGVSVDGYQIIGDEACCLRWRQWESGQKEKGNQGFSHCCCRCRCRCRCCSRCRCCYLSCDATSAASSFSAGPPHAESKYDPQSEHDSEIQSLAHCDYQLSHAQWYEECGCGEGNAGTWACASASCPRSSSWFSSSPSPWPPWSSWSSCASWCLRQTIHSQGCHACCCYLKDAPVSTCHCRSYSWQQASAWQAPHIYSSPGLSGTALPSGEGHVCGRTGGCASQSFIRGYIHHCNQL
mmetsp:Transcript_30565/g.91330  ORF Transcript_30565/g.91330 Transcript_30565/m.91330 type:complete len:316 (+) Transcript_30565:1314-2261(+)